jgi:hypothetical protein
VRDLRQQAKVPDGILTQTLQNDDRSKVILFGFAPGQEVSAGALEGIASGKTMSGRPKVRTSSSG